MKLWRGRRRKQRLTLVTLYSRPGCHLCEDARELLARLQPRYPMEIDEIDILSDPGLFRAYDIRIPVIVFADGTELEAPIREQQLAAVLRSQTRRRRA